MEPAHRNRPRFIDLPIPDDSANLREGMELHPRCASLLPLIGVWRGSGEVAYPTILSPQYFSQQVVFAHDGRPFLSYESRSWLTDSPGGALLRPAARETGWWRPQEGSTLEVIIAHNTGITEIYYGAASSRTSWHLSTDVVARTISARDVSAARRLYGLVDGGDLAYVDERAMMDQPLQPHLSARLQRWAG